METSNFEQELENSRQLLYSRAYALVNDPDKALDLVQDTMLKSLANKEKFRRNTNFKGWLYTILKNTFINNYNRQARYPMYYRDTYTDSFLGAERKIDNNNGISNLTLNEIHKEINKIDVKFSRPFIMHFEGYKYEEIAESLNLPVGTVKTRIHKARQMLQGALVG